MKYVKSFFVTWGVLLMLNQIILFHGCFAIYCLLAGLPHTGIIAFVLVAFGRKSRAPSESELGQTPFSENLREHKKKASASKGKVIKSIPTTTNVVRILIYKYVRYIGQQFAVKGDLVIYNCFIKGREDQGVSIISISPETKIINLVQCKSICMTLEHMSDIYSELDQYNFDCFQLSSYEIEEYSQYPDIDSTLRKAKKDLAQFTVRKTLYIASDKVVDLEVGPYLTMISDTIFKYKDMKIVIKAMPVG